MEKVVRINPYTDFHKIYDVLTRDTYKQYSNISYEDLKECSQYSWMVVNHYDYMLAILCAKVIKYEDTDIEIKYKRDLETLYKIEILDTFLDLDDTEIQYNDVKKINEYHVLFMLIREAMKFMSDMSCVLRISTRFCSESMQHVLKNTRFNLVNMNTEYMDFVRY